MSHDIYVSYAREDLSQVDPLVKALEFLGYSVWWDQAGLRPGDTWQDKIEQALATARCVVVFWTQAAADSQEVRAEITFAQRYDKKSVLILTEPTLPAPALASSHTATVSGWDGRPDHTAIQSVIRHIAELAGAPQDVAQEETETPPRRTRRLRVPDIAWVEIPGGPFIYQQGETRDLPTFWIARYPVTNAQYQSFIDDGGYDEPHWWRDLERPKPESPHWPQPNRPRTNVDWFEAVAFTRWLNARLSLPEGSIRLPTELEWEKAARGKEGLAYPWGNEYRSGFANVDETEYGARKSGWNLAQTTAVGLYPLGRSPYDVEDLAGTVWEWCLNKYGELEAVEPDTSGASRALRGGSWGDDPDDARAVYRYYNHPGDRYGFWGFRLLSSVPIEPVR